VQRGDVFWADLPSSSTSRPAYTRPVLVIQAGFLNKSGLKTVMVVMLDSNQRAANAPGNVWLDARETGLPEDSVLVVSQLFTIDQSDLRDYVGSVSEVSMQLISSGLKLVLELE
jgi:mRNA interferase MazF